MEEIKKRKFYYIDAMPGAGKTEYFVSRAVKLLMTDDPRIILVYVAPTVALIREAYARVLVRLEDELDLKPKAWARAKARAIANTFVVANPNSVERVFKPKKDETRHLQYQVISDPPSFALNYLFGITSRDDYRSRKYTRGFFHSLEGPVPFGSLIMTTHESFVRVRRFDEADSSFDLLKKMEIIFDEARKCVLSSKRMVLKNSYMRLLLLDLMDIEVVKAKSTPLLKGLTMSQWTLGQVATLKSADEFKQRFQVPSLTLLPAQVRDIRSQFEKAAASEGRGAMFLLSNFNPEDMIDRAERNVLLYLVQKPTSLFDGYGRVILTSAFFRDSQMFHFLREDGHVFIDLQKHSKSKDTPSIKSISERDARLRAAASKRLVVAPLLKPPTNMDGEATQRNLTRALLDFGMVIPTKLAAQIQGKLSPQMPIGEVLSRLAADKHVMPAHPELEAELKKFTVPPLWVLIWQAAKIFVGWSKGQPNMGYHPLSLLTLNAPRKGEETHGRTWAPNGIHYLGIIYRIVAYGHFVSKHGRNHDYSGSDAEDAETLQEADRMGDVWPQRLSNILFSGRPEVVFTVPRTPQLHGINKYSNRRGFTHLAALNPDPGLIRVYAGLIPKYDVDQDHSIENLVQTLYRTNLRDPDGVGPVLMIVPYMTGAHLLAKKIKCEPFKVWCVPTLTPLRHSKTVDPEDEARRIAAVKKATRKYIPDQSKEIRSVLNLIVQAKRRLVVNPDSARIVATVKKHETTLAKLRASASITKQ